MVVVVGSCGLNRAVAVNDHDHERARTGWGRARTLRSNDRDSISTALL
jgi:hypothetical protein